MARVALLDFDVHHGNGTQAVVQATVPSLQTHRFSTPFAEGAIKQPHWKPWVDLEEDRCSIFLAGTQVGLCVCSVCVCVSDRERAFFRCRAVGSGWDTLGPSSLAISNTHSATRGGWFAWQGYGAKMPGMVDSWFYPGSGGTFDTAGEAELDTQVEYAEATGKDRPRREGPRVLNVVRLVHSPRGNTCDNEARQYQKAVEGEFRERHVLESQLCCFPGALSLVHVLCSKRRKGVHHV